jgi:glycosyltransferase involved in cell wall biosynthesis
LLAGEYRALRKLLGRAAGLTAISEAYFQWALTHAGREARATDGIFPLGYPAPAGKPAEVEAIARAARNWREKLRLRDDELKVVFVGSFVSSFDFRTVIEAARRLKSAGRPVRLLFAGSGGYEAEMRRDAQGLDNLAFLGWVQDRHELAALLEVTDVGLSPYRRGCTMSLPNKPFEYMAAARPQVSSLDGELAAILDRERIGLNYVADDATALAAALERLLVEPEVRRRMGANARAVFDREYSSAVIYPRLVRHLETLARPSAS